MLKRFELPEANHPGYGTIDPLDNRYFDAAVAKYLSEQSRVIYQAYMESALAHTLAEFGICTQEIAEEIEAAARKMDIDKVYQEEKITRHDIKALVNTIKAEISDKSKPYVHFGATSYDIIANSQVLQLRDVTDDVVLPRLRELIKTLADLAEKYADTPQIGRTHGQHGVPITFGFAVAEYVYRLSGTYAALDDLSSALRGKFSGAVGAYNALDVFVDEPLRFEESVLAKAGLKPAGYSTQIAPPEQIIRLVDEYAILAGIMANLGHDMRALQRSEIAEIREKFSEGQAGSSTMAHKRNPWNFENVVSMHKQVLSQMVNANLNIASEHQRDLTDSASSRFYVLVPAITASMITRLQKVMGNIEVDDQAMRRNLDQSKGAIAAEPLYLLLEKYGHVSAHEVAKKLSQQSLKTGTSLYDIVSNDSEIAGFWEKFTADEKALIKDPAKNYLGLAAEKTRRIIRDTPVIN
ncbi:MAG TPA: lyase family protein [Candidatus Saccharimonadales bacterium]|nr:lyase family protein [Candidatus Saccharimonadales bacterium]